MAQYKVSEVIKVSFIGMIGTAIEDYDIIVAALVSTIAWPSVFFPTSDPIASLIASLGAFLITYVARPLGAFLFGHYGDRLGRKRSLVWTLITMGIGVLIISVLPGYQSIGIIAPVILFIARFIMGLGFGGEWGAVTSWIVEHAKDSRWRALWASLVPEGFAVGGIAATVTVTSLISLYGPKQFIDFYWRIPFYIGLIVIILGAILRFKLQESPIFMKIFKERKIISLPSLIVFKEKWKDIIKLAGVNMIAQTPFYVAITVMIAYLTRIIGLTQAFATYTTVVGEIVGGVLVILGGMVADIIGRKKLLEIVYITIIVFSYPYILLINTGNTLLIIIAQAMLMGLAFAGVAVLSSFIAEYFEAKYRASGTGLAYQIGVLLGVLPQSLIIAYLIGFGKGGSLYIATVVFITAVLSFISLLLCKETKGRSID
jgi:MFS family permease